MSDGFVPLNRLVLSESMRDPKAIEKQTLRLVKAFRKHGYHASRPIEVSKVYHVVNGFCRVRALLWLQENEPETFDRLLYYGLIPVRIVY